MDPNRMIGAVFLPASIFYAMVIVDLFSWSTTAPTPDSFDEYFLRSYYQRMPGDEKISRPVMPPLPRKAARYLSPEDFERARHTPASGPTEEGIKAMQLPTLFEGDIAGIPVDNFNLQMDTGDVFRYPQNSALNLVTFPDKLWPKGRIPYTLEEDLSEHERMVIAQALDEYKQKTCIRFIPKEEFDFDYIHIRKNRDLGCSSYVGRAGGNQTVSLEIDKCFSKGIVAHELMHVLGFFHEHSRTDRDKFVKIADENILPGMLRNFEKYPHKIMDTLDMPYDYGSVMHYHKLAFSRNGKSTIVPYESNAEIGQRFRLSDIDAAKVNKLYNCQDFVNTWISTTTTSGPATAATVSSTSSNLGLNPHVMEERTMPTIITIGTSPSTQTPVTASTSPTMPSTSSTTVTVTSSTSGPSYKRCEDLNDHCKMWAELGHCKWSEKYMANYCKLSCSLCDAWTVDPTSTQMPPSEAASNINSGRIDSTTSTKDCADQNLFCGYWAKIGECEREIKFMNIFCKRSCGGCQLKQHVFDQPAVALDQKRKRRKRGLGD